jgi:hypothetical protein
MLGTVSKAAFLYLSRYKLFILMIYCYKFMLIDVKIVIASIYKEGLCSKK